MKAKASSTFEEIVTNDESHLSAEFERVGILLDKIRVGNEENIIYTAYLANKVSELQ
ncbi:2641_t:CDS:2 [Cetraspora pellucida]|uniref:2641_t:CDS:1 n=1 Tax=Cetraspora pellucida TaxID=1433469 RepID=A0A9N9D540_9GLOM|nr:2641_t:CDS:2 [Cetraspora pellucida]